MQLKDEGTNEKKNVTRYKLVRHKWPDEIEEEKKHKQKQRFTIAIIIVSFCIGLFFDQVTSVITIQQKPFDKLETIYKIMKQEWYFGKDIKNLDQELINHAIYGMTTQNNDLHTSYMEPEVYEKFSTSLQGNFVGIGIQYYTADNNKAMVQRVFKGSGAEAGGMMEGDIILSVDGVIVEEKTLDEISQLIKGEEGTSVKITVLRENQPVDLTIKRGIVSDSVYGYIKEDIGVLEINSFSESSGDEVGKYLKDFSDQKKQKLIIDLRNNGGGYVGAAMQIASYLLEEGKIVYKELNKQGKVKEMKAYSNKEYPKYHFNQIVILVNKDTASASEVLTSCLKAQLENVTIVGEKTYGKGSVQLPHVFQDGSSLKYTIAEWLTPNEEHINGKGIHPDIEVSLPEAITEGILSMKEDEEVKPDTVSPYAKPVQLYLEFLGYDIDRKDEYFSIQSSKALQVYQKEHGLEANGIINNATIQSLLSSCSIYWHKNEEHLDLQMKEALNLLK